MKMPKVEYAQNVSETKQVTRSVPKQIITSKVEEKVPELPPVEGVVETTPAGSPPSLAESNAEKMETAEGGSVSEKPKTDENLTLVELARRTKAQRQAQIRFQQEQQEFEKKKLELSSRESEYQNNYISKERIKTDPLGVLTELGFDQKTLSQAVNSQPVALEMQLIQMKQKIAELEGKTTQTEERFTQKQANDYENAVNKIRNDVKQLVKSDASFDTIKELAQEETVVSFIKDTFENGYTDKDGTEFPKGYVFNVNDAAQIIEDKLVEESLRRASLTKVKSKLAPPEPPKKNEPINNKNQIKTLNNTMTAGASRKLSEAERIQRAIAIASGQLPPQG